MNMFGCIDYLSDKKKLINKMNEVKADFEELGKFGIGVEDAIKKLESATRNIDEDVLSIVLVGAFSDGKTSVVAGWLNEKTDDMKINSDESSDEIISYSPASLPDGCEIVDTPGLFGDKLGSDESGAQIRLSDMTKKYISEANVILYVVPAKNPIKDSHKECIEWILNKLNKLSSIIFVINRMDDVVDLTDEEEFESQKKIKTDTLRSKLEGYGVSHQDADKVRIVCVSAAPDGKEIDAWKDHREEYLRRSRMTDLVDATNEVLKNSRETLIAKTGCDVLNDELTKVLDEISNQEKCINEILLTKKETLESIEKELESLKKRLIESRKDIREELDALKKKKISRIRSASVETLKEVVEDEIGIEKGDIIAEEIKNIFNKYAENYSEWLLNTKDKFREEYDKQNTDINNLLNRGAKGAAVGLMGAGKINVDVYKQVIFAGRDLLGKIGVVIKFKPWQVLKMAKFAQKALPIIGGATEAIIDIADNVSAVKRNIELTNRKNEIKKAINEIFKECKELLNDDSWFFANFTPDIKKLEEQVKSHKENIEQIEEIKNKYMEWSERANKKYEDISTKWLIISKKP